MKKVISVLLAMILAFSAIAVCASAAENELQTFYIDYEVDDSKIQIVPVEGYSQYVLAGGEFKFTIETVGNYSDTFVIVQLDYANIEPDIHGIYTISDIQSDHVVKAFFSLEEEQTNMFASLIVFVRSLFEMFIDMLNSLFSFAA